MPKRILNEHRNRNRQRKNQPNRPAKGSKGQKEAPEISPQTQAPVEIHGWNTRRTWPNNLSTASSGETGEGDMHGMREGQKLGREVPQPVDVPEMRREVEEVEEKEEKEREMGGLRSREEAAGSGSMAQVTDLVSSEAIRIFVDLVSSITSKLEGRVPTQPQRRYVTTIADEHLYEGPASGRAVFVRQRAEWSSSVCIYTIFGAVTEEMREVEVRSTQGITPTEYQMKDLRRRTVSVNLVGKR